MPSATTLLPYHVLRVVVQETAHPSPSTTERWVVWPPPANVSTLQAVNRLGGYTINVSCDSPEAVDRAAELGLPSVVVLPRDTPRRTYSPGGVPIHVCPAQWSKIRCSDCGLCADRDRKKAIGFWAHGPKARKAEASLVQIRRRASQ